MSRLIKIYSVYPLVFVFFNVIVYIEGFYKNFADIILSAVLLGSYELKGIF